MPHGVNFIFTAPLRLVREERRIFKMANERKDYTFINMKTGVSKTGGTYTAVTLDARVCRPDSACTGDGDSKRISFTTPISNRGKYIEKMCGKCPKENESGTVWARVTLWRNAAERFEKLMNKMDDKTVYLIVTGAIKVGDHEGNDGKVYTNIDINADDFLLTRTYDKSDGTKKNDSAPSAAADGDVAAAPSGDKSPFVEINDDEELPF